MIDATPYKNALRVIRSTLCNADFVSDPDIANTLVDEAMMIVDLVLMEDKDNEECCYCGVRAVDL